MDDFLAAYNKLGVSKLLLKLRCIKLEFKTKSQFWKTERSSVGKDDMLSVESFSLIRILTCWNIKYIVKVG
jgi:hypothetical protein